jgi:hypothetical protein
VNRMGNSNSVTPSIHKQSDPMRPVERAGSQNHRNVEDIGAYDIRDRDVGLPVIRGDAARGEFGN